MEKLPQDPSESHKEAFISNLLARPSQKPDFSMPLPKSSVLNDIKSFLPQFKTSTEELINNDELRKNMNIDIQTNTEADSQAEQTADPSQSNKQYIEINMGVGVYDIKNPEFNEKDVCLQESKKPCLIIEDDKSDEETQKPLVQEIGASNTPMQDDSDDSDSSDGSEPTEEDIQKYEAFVRSYLNK
ncbi:unnamed protein product [Moneuplotes crassus]|uniref:Uncharacterized protein n=1 Tax=Euplotes crassus TaxID=5936 RepID=A0AAD1UM31_EUPCR|nr:unnamed protein product [Moneuplotes crassus]